MPNAPILAPGPFVPLSRTAIGPNFSEGQPYSPRWTPNLLMPGKVEVIPANFGEEGGLVGYRRRTLDIIGPGNPIEPTSLVHKPIWNNLTPVITWNLQVLTAQQLATFENAQNVQAPQIPVAYTPPSTASLLK